ncbi:hypothetical protein HRM2_26410 [Desulforapulum autotrophicum HRM2]|uniref:Uncharacterized protein n=1 Tax=Desulforapulum autotrophicum (strain ATCC 43914 / DSM 3382 / VKM B-1955 / HRM2) TaxID=177437 RepID=C0QHZ9_DESAH|nr:hypothetical protein HRM2_26410 [Desulforapulum autotrophicum HRM2]
MGWGFPIKLGTKIGKNWAKIVKIGDRHKIGDTKLGTDHDFTQNWAQNWAKLGTDHDFIIVSSFKSM